MKKIIILLAVLLSACSRPIAVYNRVVPSSGESFSPHYEFKCWIYNEHYDVLGKYSVDGLIYIANADYSCAGDARIEDLK